MEIISLTLFAACVVQVASQSALPRCLLSREDFIACQYRNRALLRAKANEYTAHFTRLRRDSVTGDLICNVRALNQNISAIPNVGTDEMRVLFSPGYTTGDQYENELRVEYLVQCGENELAFYNVTDLSTQRKEDCTDLAGNEWCQDYLQIVRPSAGAVEECGTTPSQSSVLQLESGNFTVVFRTSEDPVVGDGFQMYVLCFRPAETSLPDCTEVSEFTAGVCATGGGSQPPNIQNKRSAGYRQGWPAMTSNGFPNSGHQNRGTRQRWPYNSHWTPHITIPSREVPWTGPPIATYYTDLFPDSGFPPNLRIAPDLALFHHKWNRLRRRPGVKFTAVDILYNETVNYTRNTITVMDLRGQILARYCYVRLLKTFDSSGIIKKYFNGVRENRNPHFHGAGLLRIVDRVAYFQLFRIDPRGIVPDEEEQRELLLMNMPLLDSIFIKKKKSTPRHQRFRYYNQQYHRNFYPWRSPRDINNPQFSESDKAAVLAALRSEDSCNAVLRAQSRATLTFYSEIDTNFVECLKTFNISCGLTGDGLLNCTSDDTIVPGRTTCQIDDLTPIACDPFSESIEIIATPGDVAITVTAINCDGQTAEDEVAFED